MSGEIVVRPARASGGSEPLPPKNVFFRGLGNMASKVIYLAAQPCQGEPGTHRKFKFTHGLLKPDELARKNLRFLAERGFLEPGAHLFIAGDAEEEQRIRHIVGRDFHVFNERDLSLAGVPLDLFMDFTFDAQPLVSLTHQTHPSTPVIVQSNNYGSGVLWVPPLQEAKRSKRTSVFRAADCSLSGTVPVLAPLRPYLESIFLHFTTDRNAGKSPESGFDNTFYFSDRFPVRKSQEFSALTGRPVLTTFQSSGVINPFYIATVDGILDMIAIERQFGSRTRFDKVGFGPLLQDQPRIHACQRDNTSRHRRGPEPETVREFASEYPTLDHKPFIVYFGRTFLRRNGHMVSFKIGFDVNLSAAIANLDLMEAVFAK